MKFKFLKNKKIFSIIILALIFIAEIIFFIIYHNTWYDEANYQYQGWAIFEFGWVPYADVWTRIPPLVFYIFGLPQYLFGPSLLVGRITSAVIFAVAIILMYQIAKKLGGKTAGLISMAFIIFTPYLVRFYVSGAAYSIAILFVLASFWSLVFIKEKYQVVFSLLFASLAVLARQTLAPMLLILFIYWLIVAKNKKTRVLSILIPFFSLGLVLLPFVFIDYHNFIKDSFWFLSGNDQDMPLAFHRNYSFFGLIYLLIRRLIDIFREYTSIIFLFSITIIGLLIKDVRQKIKKWFSEKEYQFILLLVVDFIVLFSVHYLIPNPLKFVIYSLYFMPLAVLSFSIIAGKLIDNLTIPAVKKMVIWLLAVSIFLSIVTVNYNDLYKFLPNNLSIANTDLGKIDLAADKIKKYFSKGDLVFYLDEPHLALDAGLKIPPALSYRFELYKTVELAKEDQGRYWNLDTAKEWFNEFDGAILQKGRWQAWFEVRNLFDDKKAIEQLLAEHCQLVEEVPQAYPEKYYFDPEGIALVYTCNR